MSKQAEKSVILWFRKDLRLDDNHALHAACATGKTVIPVYIREPDANGNGPLGGAQKWWLHHSLLALDKSLHGLQSRLLFLSGDPLTILRKLIEDNDADTVLWNRRYDPPGSTTDRRVMQELRDKEIDVRSFSGQLLHEPTKLLTGGGTPYKVYTPFWRALEAGGEPPEPLPKPREIRSPSHWPKSEKLAEWSLLPEKPDWAQTFSEIWTPGEEAAQWRLDAFVDEGLKGYKEGRDFPSRSASSMLSPHLALGEISPARIWHATRGLSPRIPADDIVHFRKEIAWRDFSYHLLFHFPPLPYANWNNRFDGFPWRNDTKLFEQWTRGMTGFPIIDAGMRQLWRHGWMHNRVRMIVASFLIKDLMIDWRHGESWFRDTLVDADPASNAASWQWVAGSGADASPFFRIFNPVLQGEKFDPDGTYVRTFVPELSAMDAKYIHKPHEAPAKILDAAGIILGETYPHPIVDHAKARDRALEAYNVVKDAA